MKTWIMETRKNWLSLEELKAYDSTYRTAARCGFSSPEEMWEANPIVGGSTDPADFGLVPEGGRIIRCSRRPTESEIKFGYGCRIYCELYVPKGRKFIHCPRGHRYTVPK